MDLVLNTSTVNGHNFTRACPTYSLVPLQPHQICLNTLYYYKPPHLTLLDHGDMLLLDSGHPPVTDDERTAHATAIA